MISINRAIKEATKSNHSNHKHATLLFKGGALKACGFNLGNKHSEMVALSRVKHKGGARNMIALNIRLTKGGVVSMAKPCNNCNTALINAGIRQVKYTDYDGVFQTESY